MESHCKLNQITHSFATLPDARTTSPVDSFELKRRQNPLRTFTPPIRTMTPPVSSIMSSDSYDSAATSSSGSAMVPWNNNEPHHKTRILREFLDCNRQQRGRFHNGGFPNFSSVRGRNFKLSAKQRTAVRCESYHAAAGKTQ